MMRARTLFCIHGMWGGAWCWDVFRTYFEERGYRCVAATLRYHENKDDPPPELGNTSLLDYADDLEEQIRALEEMPILIGHSMGGLLTQMLAARGVAAAAVCLMPAPPMGILAMRRPSVLIAFLEGTHRILRHEPLRSSYPAARYAVFNGLPEKEARRLYDLSGFESGRAISEIGMRTYRGLFPNLDPDRASDVDETKVGCPMFVMGGRRDRITPLPIARKVAEKYGADYQELAGHAHWVLSGPGWQDVAARVETWIRRLESAGPEKSSRSRGLK